MRAYSEAHGQPCLVQVDNAIQYGEDADVKVREFGDFEDPDD